MLIATWNVNSIKQRLDAVKGWLGTHKPDVLMLQELKGMDFPAEEFKAIGYYSAFVPQKAYNGVATLSRHPIETILNKLPGDDTDEQARYLETQIKSFRFVNIYLPNGNPVESEKYPYKLRWMDRLRAHLEQLRLAEVPAAVCGDFNIIPEDRDCHDPKVWAEDALFRLESRQKFRAILNLGFTDAFRAVNQNSQEYTFWDYQAGCWPQNKGIRIDHILLAPALTDRLLSCAIDKAPRGAEKASDHTPIMATLRE